MKKRFKIPWPEQWRRQTRLPASGNNLIYTPKDFIISFTLYIVTVIACMLLRSLDKTGDTSYVAMLFLTDVFLTAVLTDGYLFSILCAILGVFSVDYIFTEPYWHISFTLAGFPLTFLVMMTISILAGALASRAKQMEATQRQMTREKMRGNLLRGMGHDIHYFAWVNLKGVVISLAIGMAVYFLLIRTRLIDRDGRYLSRWPKWLSMEESLYKPFFRALYAVLNVVCRAVCDSLDILVLLVQRTLLRSSREKPVRPYPPLVRAIARQNGGDDARTADRLATDRDMFSRLTSSLSFGLLLTCLGLCTVLTVVILHTF